MRDVAIVGAFENKHGVLSEQYLREMISQVGNGAIRDAKIDRKDIQAVYVGNYGYDSD